MAASLVRMEGPVYRQLVAITRANASLDSKDLIVKNVRNNLFYHCVIDAFN